jgi:hypothetical protein
VRSIYRLLVTVASKLFFSPLWLQVHVGGHDGRALMPDRMIMLGGLLLTMAAMISELSETSSGATEIPPPAVEGSVKHSVISNCAC